MFSSEKHCREETIGRAAAMVRSAKAVGRSLTAAELSRINGLLSMAEAVLGINSIPREPEALLRSAQAPQRHFFRGRNVKRPGDSKTFIPRSRTALRWGPS